MNGIEKMENSALAYFQAEEYAKAIAAYTEALTYEPDNLEWRAMLALAEANLLAETGKPCHNSVADDEDEPFFSIVIAPLSSVHVYFSLN